MDTFVLGALLQQAHAVKAFREVDYYREHEPRSNVQPQGLLVGVLVASLVLSVFGISVI